MTVGRSWKALERGFMATLGLWRRPVAVTFLDAPPANITKFEGSEPSGCSFWRLATDGRVFYTVPEDHFNCPVGSYTQRMDLPASRASEMEQTLGMMFAAGYLRPEELPGIQQLPKTPAAVVYAPLGDAPMEPSVVVFMCPPGTAMLLNEAATRAGKAGTLPILGRPTCMALPAAMEHGTTTSLGCAGNRVYTGADEKDLYIVVPGKDLHAVAEALETIVNANQTMSEYARGRRVQLSTE